ncbi:HNH endonuclease [Verrucomicrobium spinosum]|uniref:HNH endonuclease n=1 Tax=Verrucomicrobium spinosum TaxID=2736 RepID=UPI0012E163D7|nr:hypothetical protein [Verrucomicrobium spinosum]
MKNKDLKVRLVGIASRIKECADEYDRLAGVAQLHRILAHTGIASVTKKELMAIYDVRMVGQDGPGRGVYNTLIDRVLNRDCPLCDAGVATTLDHHLPKSKFPSLSVAPYNLVPACPWCQREKLAKLPQNSSEECFHPYYDDVEAVEWLDCIVLQGSPGVIKFIVSERCCDQSVMERAKSHMKTFNLGRLYSLRAASQITGSRAHFAKVYDKGGAAALSAHLLEVSKSWYSIHKNSWQAAMHRAASESDWFCNGGFNEWKSYR